MTSSHATFIMTIPLRSTYDELATALIADACSYDIDDLRATLDLFDDLTQMLDSYIHDCRDDDDEFSLYEIARTLPDFDYDLALECAANCIARYLDRAAIPLIRYSYDLIK